ncbi:hypothetical protein [Phenylobacterium deserti]|uniref:hypothetical protein n=1 Tax=Phenylobacterium deserti TaxID=1914756 RepID=UPI001402E7A4|nr:hypothetical protein [Phenylobacterium deserti]
MRAVAKMVGGGVAGLPAAMRTFRHSPNRQRLAARTALWTVGLSAVAFWAPHLLLHV